MIGLCAISLNPYSGAFSVRCVVRCHEKDDGFSIDIEHFTIHKGHLANEYSTRIGRKISPVTKREICLGFSQRKRLVYKDGI